MYPQLAWWEVYTTRTRTRTASFTCATAARRHLAALPLDWPDVEILLCGQVARTSPLYIYRATPYVMWINSVHIDASCYIWEMMYYLCIAVNKAISYPLQNWQMYIILIWMPSYKPPRSWADRWYWQNPSKKSVEKQSTRNQFEDWN